VERWAEDFDKYQRRRALSAGTIKKRQEILNMWVPWLEDRELTVFQASRRDVETWMDGRRHLTDKTLYSNLSNLAAFYKWAAREGWMQEDPTKDVERPRVKPGVPNPISDADLAVALKYADPKMRCFLTLMAYGGLRCMEVAGLERGHLDLGRKTMRITGKGNKVRVVPMHPEILKALEVYGLARAGFLFRRRDGQRHMAHDVSHQVNHYLADAGIAAHAHSLRHWFGTEVVRGAGIRVGQDLLGHASPTTTAGYSQVSGDDARDAVTGLKDPGARNVQ
jgi:site-specific recombinase XerD